MASLIKWISDTHPSWADAEILNWENTFPRRGPVDIQQFVTTAVYERNAPIDMRLVVGQWDHYAGQTWFEAATDPAYKESKMRGVFSLFEKNPDYYFNGEIANEINLCSMDGKSWYSNSGGNHRTVVAKFACEKIATETGTYPLIKGVSKNFYQIEKRAWELFSKLQSFTDLGIHSSVERTQLSCTTGEKEITEYELKFHVCDFRFKRTGLFGNDCRCQHLSTKEFCQYARWVISNNAALTRYDKWMDRWTHWFGDRDQLIYNASAFAD